MRARSSLSPQFDSAPPLAIDGTAALLYSSGRASRTRLVSERKLGESAFESGDRIPSFQPQLVSN
jgi:hypothetical protein